MTILTPFQNTFYLLAWSARQKSNFEQEILHELQRELLIGNYIRLLVLKKAAKLETHGESFSGIREAGYLSFVLASQFRETANQWRHLHVFHIKRF